MPMTTLSAITSCRNSAVVYLDSCTAGKVARKFGPRCKSCVKLGDAGARICKCEISNLGISNGYFYWRLEIPKFEISILALPPGHSHLGRSKCPDIRKFGNPLVGGPVCVRAAYFNADENRATTTLSGLHRCSELEGMAWDHTVVVISRGHKSRRITHSGFGIVDRRILNKISELL